MKKIVVVTQFIVLLLFLAKIVALGEVMTKPNAAGISQASVRRLGSEPPAGVVIPQATGGAEADGPAKNRDLFAALEVKKNELDKKEQFLRAEEQRLLLLKKEIVEKIDILRVQEEKLNATVEVKRTTENKNFKDLAKVFEATPPAKAGVMMEKLDIQTAAGITMNMKRDKAGAIWGYLSPQKAVEITREITHLGKQ